MMSAVSSLGFESLGEGVTSALFTIVDIFRLSTGQELATRYAVHQAPPKYDQQYKLNMGRKKSVPKCKNIPAAS
eukprot:7115806-Pyramimonas_sp.AAC.1